MFKLFQYYQLKCLFAIWPNDHFDFYRTECLGFSFYYMKGTRIQIGQESFKVAFKFSWLKVADQVRPEIAQYVIP